jgi:hypothetical protein
VIDPSFTVIVNETIHAELMDSRANSSILDRDWAGRMRLETQASSNENFSDTDEHTLRILLAEARHNLDSIEADISPPHTVLRNSEKHHTQSLARIELLQAELTPHKKVPPELWSKVFVYALADNEVSLRPCYDHSSVWAITHVCSRWREIALAEPYLWSQISSYCYSPIRSTIGLAHEILSNRGGISTIQLSISIREPDDLDRTINLISTHPSRLRKLRLNVDGPLSILDLPPIESLTNLETLAISLTFTWYRSASIRCPQIKSFSMARSLTIVELTFYEGLLSSTWPEIGIVLPWQQLRHLVISTISIPMFSLILVQCAQLISFNVVFERTTPQESTHNPTHPIQLNYLRSMNIRPHRSVDIRKLLVRFIVPALKEIVFSGLRVWPPEEILHLVDRSECALEKFTFYESQYAVPLAYTVPLMKAMPDATCLLILPSRLPYSEDTDDKTDETIILERSGSKLVLQWWGKTSIRDFIHSLHYQLRDSTSGIMEVIVQMEKEDFVPHEAHFKVMSSVFEKMGKIMKIVVN